MSPNVMYILLVTPISSPKDAKCRHSTRRPNDRIVQRSGVGLTDLNADVRPRVASHLAV